MYDLFQMFIYFIALFGGAFLTFLFLPKDWVVTLVKKIKGRFNNGKSTGK